MGPWQFRGSDDLPGAEALDYEESGWETVRVPHTWGKRPYRSAWYRTRFAASAGEGRRVFLYFEGAATFADVYVNGHHLGQHRGAYTRFLYDATPHVAAGQNLLAVQVNNDPSQTVDSLPSGRGKKLYQPYGGLYRKVWLLTTGPLHVDPTDHASSGVFVTPTKVGAESAEMEIRTRVRNTARPRTAEVVHRLFDRGGQEVMTLSAEVEAKTDETTDVVVRGALGKPHLWSPSDPYLYTLWTEVHADGKPVDVVRERVGFRDFRLQDRTFLLNGAPILLRGTGKHQESEENLTALIDDEIREDFAHLKDLGANFVRLAHYPHAELAYDLADEVGLLVWAENGHSNTNKAEDTGDTITREMIRQNYNHPSIVMWSVGNETGFVRVNRYAAVAQAEDPVRLVTYASNTGTKGKKRYGDLDLIAHNMYRGWYRGLPWEFEERALALGFLSESGGGAVITNHTGTRDPQKVIDHFEPEEYRQLLAEIHFQVVFRDHPAEVPLYLVWILRDFGIEKYKDVWNTKGLLTYSNFRKDAYYLYKSFLRPQEPVVHLASKTYFLRRGSATSGIKAYSNRPSLSLTLNGVPQGVAKNGEYQHGNGRHIANVFFWGNALRPGRNDVVVDDGAGHRDSAIVYHASPERRSGADDTGAPIRDLRSSNPKSRAFLIDQAVQEQWPFYYEFDGTADNTFHRLPRELAGARWIATPRLSKPENRTDLSFTTAGKVHLFLMGTEGKALGDAARAAGFQATQIAGRWRDNDLRLVGFRVFERKAGPGERVTIRGVTADYVVLVRPIP